MSDQLMTFDEFRLSNHDTLRAQREQLRDDERAAGILRDAAAAKGWAEWPNAMGS